MKDAFHYKQEGYDICGTDVAVYKHGTGLGHKIEIGGFSEYIKSPVTNVGVEVYPVSDKISDRLAALIEPFYLTVLKNFTYEKIFKIV